MPSMHLNEHELTVRYGVHKGRLIRPSRYCGEGNRPESKCPTHFTNAIYSDDGAKTWQASEPLPENGPGEASIVELSDGRHYYNLRRHRAPVGKSPLRRWIATIHDGGRMASKALWNRQTRIIQEVVAANIERRGMARTAEVCRSSRGSSCMNDDGGLDPERHFDRLRRIGPCRNGRSGLAQEY